MPMHVIEMRSCIKQVAASGQQDALPKQLHHSTLCVVLEHLLSCFSRFSCRVTTDGYDTDKMAAEFCMQFCPSQLALTVGQSIVYQFQDKKKLMLQVKELEGWPLSRAYPAKNKTIGRSFLSASLYDSLLLHSRGFCMCLTYCVSCGRRLQIPDLSVQLELKIHLKKCKHA